MSGNVISLIPSSQAVADKSRLILLPMIGLLVFLLAWHLSARQVETSLGTLPGPVDTFQQFSNLLTEHHNEREKEQLFIERQEQRSQAGTRSYSRGENSPIYRQADLFRPNHHQLGDGGLRVYVGQSYCYSTWHCSWAQPRALHGVQPDYPIVKAGFALGMVADCHHGGQCNLRQ